MALVSDIEADQDCGDLLNDAGILQLSSVKRAHPGNFSRQLANTLSRGFVIAAYDHVTIDWAVLLEKVSGQVMKRGYHYYAFRNKFRRLLRGRALPHAQSTRRLSAHTCRQRHGRIHKNLSGTQGRLDVLQHLSLSFERNRKDDDL